MGAGAGKDQGSQPDTGKDQGSQPILIDILREIFSYLPLTTVIPLSRLSKRIRDCIYYDLGRCSFTNIVVNPPDIEQGKVQIDVWELPPTSPQLAPFIFPFSLESRESCYLQLQMLLTLINYRFWPKKVFYIHPPNAYNCTYVDFRCVFLEFVLMDTSLTIKASHREYSSELTLYREHTYWMIKILKSFLKLYGRPRG
jgi:hypothetical protein